MSKTTSLTTAGRIKRSLERSQQKVRLRSDFESFASSSQLTRVLNRLISEGRILRVSTGVYVIAKPSSLTGAPVPALGLTELIEEVFKRLNVTIYPSRATRDYNERLTTQLPGRLSVSTGKRRITRTVQAGAQTLTYEKSSTEDSAGTTRRRIRASETA